MGKLVTSFIISSLLQMVSSGSIYFSLIRIQALTNSEKVMIQELSNYMEQTGDNNERLVGFLAETEHFNNKAASNTYFMANPLNVFRTMYRLTVAWDHLIAEYFNQGIFIKDPNECIDDNDNCADWSERGECEKSADYMRQHCRKSCNLCTEGNAGRNCADDHENCAFWSETGECEKNPAYMLVSCRLSCAVCIAVPELTEQEVATPTGQVISAYRNLKLKGDPSPWPTLSDLSGTAVGLMRLINTYKINVDQLIQGHIMNIHTDPLTLRETQELALRLYLSGEFYGATLFYEHVLGRMTSSPFSETNQIPWRATAEELAISYSLIQLPHYAIKTMQNYSEQDPNADVDSLQSLMTRFESELDKYPADYSESTHPHRPTTHDGVYESLCRGEQLKTAAEQAGLSCRYRPSSIPYKPTKEETVNVDPPIVLFHNVISPSEMAAIKTLANGSLVASTVVKADGGLKTTTKRISMSAFLDEHLDPLLQKLNRRINIITGLSMREEAPMHVEPLQVLNYGVGGMYEPHHDYFRNSDKSETNTNIVGDRVSTFMFYLNDVQLGGSTVYPNARTAVPVTPGGAAFWYNLDPYGEPDDRTLHAGCPVLVGSKWVANKWTREVGQAFSRRCPLTPPNLASPPTTSP